MPRAAWPPAWKAGARWTSPRKSSRGSWRISRRTPRWRCGPTDTAAGTTATTSSFWPPWGPGGGGAFRDDFEGSKLNPAWKILKEDKNRWTLEGGKLVLVTQKGSIAEKQDDLRNQFILDRPLPDNYTVNVKLAVALRSHNNWAGFQIYLDKDNYLNLGYWAKPWGNNIWRQAFFSKEAEGQGNRLELGPRHIGGGGGGAHRGT